MNTYIRSLFIIAPICIVIALLVQMVLANQAIVYSHAMEQTKARMQQLEEQNEYLRGTITSLSSIQRIEQVARAEGFSEAASSVAFDASLSPVALKR
jgi:cell division protein FtsL